MAATFGLLNVIRREEGDGPSAEEGGFRMLVVLDTDHLTLLQRQSPEADHILRRLDRLAPDDIAATIVSFQEQFQGWLTYLNKRERLNRSCVPTVNWMSCGGRFSG